MVEPLDLVQVRHDQRRTAALLGQCSCLSPIGKYGGHPSYLPISYWGKPRDVKLNPRPNVSFIRTVLNDERFSLPNIDNKLPQRNGESQSKLTVSSQSADKELSLAYVQRKRDSRLLNKSIPTSHPIRYPNSDRRLNSPDRTLRHQTDRLPHICEAQPGNNPDSNKIWKHDGVPEQIQPNKFLERLTVHVPGQDGLHGHSIVQKLSSSGEVLPPLVSIHSSVSTANHRLSDNSHFPYHHTKSDERPNLPHSDSTLSCTGGAIPRDQSPLYTIRSIGHMRANGITDSPLTTFDSGPTHNSLNIGLSQSHASSDVSGRSSKLVGYKTRTTRPDFDTSNGVDVSVSMGDIAAYPVYSDISSSVGSILDFNPASNPSVSFDGSFGLVDTLVQDSPKLSPLATEDNPMLMNQTYIKGQMPQKGKLLKVLDKGGNIHRRAYLAALSVARSNQLPNHSRQLGKRISRPFQFSYFEHVPHQRPCRCRECIERMVNNAIVPKKNKKKTLSPMKSIFGSVKVEDYYF